VLTGLGEAIAQALQRTSSSPSSPSRAAAWLTSLKRVLQLAGYGALWSGPSNHYFNLFLESLFKNWNSGAIGTLISKTIVDQLLYGPCCTATFLSWVTLVIERGSLGDLLRLLKRRFWPIQKQSWRFWPLAALVCYTLPRDLRLVFMSAVGVAWCVSSAARWFYTLYNQAL
jgi:hypothetical protein